MKISDLINKLQEIQMEHGDLNVTIDDFNLEEEDIVYFEKTNEVVIYF